MKKIISILGSTGSIGLSTLRIVDKKSNYFTVNILLANKNYNIICKQIKKYKPKVFIINNYTIYTKIKRKFNKKNIKILNNLESANLNKSDITISAIPGIAGLKPTLSIIKLTKKLLIANKEAIICGWNLIKNKAATNKVKIIPVDSEHFSIMKLIENYKLNDIKKIYITASGGPFLNYKVSQFKKIKPSEAIKHPKWKMGKKISIDSSTLMNKMFELVEAQKLFNLPDDKIDVLIHPDSLVHAIVVFNNGLTKFIYHETSMIIPLANAIFEKNLTIDNFFKIKNNNKQLIARNLTFQKPNEKIFPILKLKRRINEHPSTSIILNAANEILVDQFLKKKIPFLGISKMIIAILKDSNYKKYAIRNPKNLDEVMIIDKWTRESIFKKLSIHD